MKKRSAFNLATALKAFALDIPASVKKPALMTIKNVTNKNSHFSFLKYCSNSIDSPYIKNN